MKSAYVFNSLSKFRTILKSMIVLILLFGFILSINVMAAQDSFTIKVQSVYTGPLAELDEKVLDIVAKSTAGRIKFELYQAGEILPSTQILEGVGKGLIDAGTDYPSYWMGKDKAFDLLGTHPVSWTLYEFLLWYYMGGGRDFYTELYGRYNCVYFPYILMGPESGFRTNKIINSLSDYKGLKLRTASYMTGKILEEIGASPTAIPFAEAYDALQKNIIDGVEMSAPSNDWNSGLQEITKYVSCPSWHQPYGVCGLILNKDFWEKLPEDLRLIIEASLEAQMHRQSYELLYRDAIAHKKFLDAGIQVGILSNDDLDKLEEIKVKLQEEEIAKGNELYNRILKSQVDFMKSFEEYKKVLAPYFPGRIQKVYPNFDTK